MDTLKALGEALRPSLPYVVAGGAVVVVTGMFAHRKLAGTARKSGQGSIVAPHDTPLIYQVRRGPYAPSMSPFPLKLETYCRLANIPYMVDTTARFSSRGKFPWMTYNGEVVEDSQFCIEYLNTKRGVDLNRHLNQEQRAVARFIQVMVEEHLFWTIALHRYVFGDPEPPRKKFGMDMAIFMTFRKIIQAQAHGQGMGRHSKEEVKAFMMEDLQRLSDFLGNKSFIMGEEVCEADCSVFGMLSQMVWHAFDDVMTNLLEDKFQNLYQYCHRMKDKVWPDWDECCKNAPDTQA